MTARFTIDGGPVLEARLQRICELVRGEITALIPEKNIAAIVLGGGYGRGEGGVLRTDTGEEPYNDLDFYIFLRGRRIVQEYRFGRKLHELGGRLSICTGIEVEFKIDRIERWRNGPVSMFSYDLVSGHRMITGDESVFAGCGHHCNAAAIPLAEASRLVFNRCAGLLVVREVLRKPIRRPEEADFAVRNVAKAQLALGDVVLTAFGQYHWSARERRRRLADFAPPEPMAWLADVQSRHEHGLAFKLHPWRASSLEASFEDEYARLVDLAQKVWLWLESRRLNRKFLSASDYALGSADKWPSPGACRNYCLSLRTFGPKAALESFSWRYPRARLFNALALLLWNSEQAAQPPLLNRLRRELHTNATDWASLVTDFKRIWPAYG